ncbi:MAG: branched-chain amino acid ABC transporter permease [Rhodocyclales bacterium]|nr:branched-chain amino acid ABC transporter permease [Rhodocyclales bacterium]
MNSVFGKTGAAYLAGVILLLLAPLAIYPVLVMKVLCFALFACAFNLLLGYTGQLSFGHAAFLGSAAYLTGHALKVWEVPTLLGLLLGTAGAAVLGWVVGSLAIRRQGIYFTMTTLALAQMMFFVFIRSPFTGGEDGLQDVPRGSVFGIDLNDDGNLYYLVVAIFCGAFWLIRRIIDSPFGQILKAIRENEPRTISLGYDVARYKLLAFVLSAALAGLAGATKTLVFTFATLTDAHWHASGEVVLMTLVGGVGTVFGPLVGATIIVALQNLLADKVGSLVTVIMGGIFVLCVLAFRRGVVGESIALYRRMIGERP